MSGEDIEWKIDQLLFADDAGLKAGTQKLSCSVRKFGRVCERKKLKINVGKSEVLKFSSSREQETLSVRR